MGKEALALEYNGRYKIMGYLRLGTYTTGKLQLAGWIRGDIFVNGVRCTASIEGAKEYSDGLNMKSPDQAQ